MKPPFFEGRFPPSARPLGVKGGIRARSRRGAFAQTWWARRWIAVLEALELGGRLSRARHYARRGQVAAVALGKGRVEGVVQGTRPKPYNVTIETQTLSLPEWTRVVEEMAGQARFAAALLAGQMPADVEQAFAAAGLSLFPSRREDLRTSCTCPDWSNPCKHIAAVYYLLGEEFDRDPFLVFRLRGLDRDELVHLLNRATVTVAARATEQDATGRAPEPAAGEPLPAKPGAFWQGGDLPADFLGEIEPPPATAALLARLGAFPFWRGRQPLDEALAPVYAAASARAADLLLGRSESPLPDRPDS